MQKIEVETRHGPARVHLHPVARARAALVLGHGAGGGVGAQDLRAASEAALAQRVAVVFVEQPYRVAGRRSPCAAPETGEFAEPQCEFEVTGVGDAGP